MDTAHFNKESADGIEMGQVLALPPKSPCIADYKKLFIKDSKMNLKYIDDHNSRDKLSIGNFAI
jgi:hypothetical protein